MDSLLVTGFLTQLCQRTQAPAYCQTAARFNVYLHTPPTVTLLTQRATAKRTFTLRFRLSKVSHVGIMLLRGTRTILATSATFAHGVRRVSVAGLTRGTYTVHLAATDPASNFQRTAATLIVRPRRSEGRARRLAGSMTPRTILYTGKGGVGKTSVAACTARRCAGAGLRTLVMSTDPAHSLSESLEAPLGGEPSRVGGKLWGQEIHAQREMTRHWGGVQEWLGGLLVERGIDRISAEELTVPPGMDELFSLLRLQEQHSSGGWDVIVVDCAPTGETLRLLSFPEIAQWWLDKVFPAERQILAAAGPLARMMLDLPLPTPEVLADIRRLSENLIAMNQVLRDRQHSSLRLVMNPDRMVIGEAMRTFTYLNLYGFMTDAVVVNKVFPDEVGDYFSGWRRMQAEHLDLVRSAFTPVPVLCAPFFEQEVVGPAMLDRLADSLFTDTSPAELLHDSITQTLSGDETGATLRLSLPFTSKEEISLKQVGNELIVTLPGQRRTIVLPPALTDCRPSAARFDDGHLEVSFQRNG